MQHGPPVVLPARCLAIPRVPYGSSLVSRISVYVSPIDLDMNPGVDGGLRRGLAANSVGLLFLKATAFAFGGALSCSELEEDC